MNRGELRAEVYRQFGESAGFITDSDVDAWINLGYQEFATDAEFIRKKETGVTFTESQPYWDLPSHFWRPFRVVRTVDGKESSRIPPRSAIPAYHTDIVISGENSVYNIDDNENRLTIEPAPLTDLIANIYYIACPSSTSVDVPFLVADGDIPLIPERFHEGIVLAVLKRANKKDRDTEARDRAEREYRDYLSWATRLWRSRQRDMETRTCAWTNSYIGY